MKNNINLQDAFLNKVRKENTVITIFLVNGYQIKGIVRGFDNYTIVLEEENKQNIIYKHAISTIVPIKKVDFINKNNTDIKQDNFIDYINENNKKDIDYGKDIINKNESTNSINLNDKIVIKEEGIDFNIGVDNTINIKDEEPKYKEESKYNLPTNFKVENRLPEFKIIGKLFSTYILAEGVEDSSFYLIDQHAAHERVTYEAYKSQYEREEIISQKLLVPEVINLTSNEIDIIKNYIKTFRNLGFEIDEFGINSIILRSVPLIFGKPDHNSFIDILDNIKSNLTSNYDITLDKIMKLACTNSIKGGDNISEMEIDRLLQDLSQCENPYTCPHGRPIIIKMTKYEIEKKFKRIQ